MTATRTKEELVAEIHQLEHKIRMTQTDLDLAREPLQKLYRERAKIDAEIALHKPHEKQCETALTVYGRQRLEALGALRKILQDEAEAQFQALVQKS